MLSAIDSNDKQKIKKSTEKISVTQKKTVEIKKKSVNLIKKANSSSDGNDTNYIFISFVINFLPVGLVGLVLAAILSASMSSTAAELNALASTTVIDVYKRLIKKDANDKHYLLVSKLATIFWGAYAITFALFANRLGTLIEAVNILGSLVYGTILGIFLVAFYLKKVKSSPTFYAALIAELTVIYCFIFTEIPFLWFNVIGCMLVIMLSLVFNALITKLPVST